MYNNFFPQVPQPYLQSLQPTTPKQEVVKVNGENGARTYAMGPNSSALLLDESGLLVWLVVTDGAGYKSVGAYDITPHKEKPAPDLSDLENRIKKLEEMLNGDASDNADSGRRASGSAARTDSASKRYDPYGTDRKQPGSHAAGDAH